MMLPEPRVARRSPESSWRKPRETTPGLLRYLETVRERKWLVFAVTALTLLVAIAYLAHASKVYEAKAELLITPISGEDSTLSGLALIRESSDPTRGVETGAALATSRSVGERVIAELGLEESVEELGSQVSATPVAASNLVVIAAQEGSPEQATRIANSYAKNAIADRDAKLRSQLNPVIADLKERIEGGEQSLANSTLPEQLTSLERLYTEGDPTIQFETKATPETSPVSPKPALTIVVALIGGLVLGLGAAFLMQALDPRLRREEQLRELYGLPILARVPREAKGGALSRRRVKRGARREPLAPSSLTPRALESFRMLRTMLTAAGSASPSTSGLGRAIMVTGPSPAEGKTTTAINLASSYALAGKRVILIEADFRRPAIASALKIIPRVGIDRVLLDEISLEEALVPVSPFSDGQLRLLPAGHSDSNLSELLSMPTARGLLDDARHLADYVIIDSPPLTEVIDALPLAHYIDDLLIVTRLGMSSLLQLSRLADLLEQNSIVPRGFVVVGAVNSNEGSYYFDTAERGPRLGPQGNMPQPEAAAGNRRNH